MVHEPEEGRSPDEDEGGPVKSFLEHLEDLRWALVKSVAAAGIGILICLLAGKQVVAVLVRPLEKATVNYKGDDSVVVVRVGNTRLGTYTLDDELSRTFNLDTNRFATNFIAADIIAPAALAARLTPGGEGFFSILIHHPADLLHLGKDELSPWLYSQLSPETKALLGQKQDGDYAALKAALAADFNRIIHNDPIYDAARFKQVTLSEATKALAASKSQGDAAWLNRVLLLEAYPGVISKTWDRFSVWQVVPTPGDASTKSARGLSIVRNMSVNAEALAEHMQTGLNAFGPAKAFFIGFRVALYAGIGMASPFIFFFMGQFILPALKIRERKYLYRGLAFAVPLFLTGVCFCYFVLMPAALAASQIYSNWFGFSSDIWDAGDYIDFVCKFMLGMGLGFELPVVLLVLVKIGLLNYDLLAKARPYMIVINLVLGAMLTTPEVFTQVLMAVPLQLLYEMSVWIAWYWERKDRKRAAAESREA
jgi:Tat protein translocase TatC